MNRSPIHHLTRENYTQKQMEVAMEPGPWEPQTIIVVIIFGLVCLLHLTAFLYTVCFQNYGNLESKSFVQSIAQVGEDTGESTSHKHPSESVTEPTYLPHKQKSPILTYL